MMMHSQLQEGGPAPPPHLLIPPSATCPPPSVLHDMLDSNYDSVVYPSVKKSKGKKQSHLAEGGFPVSVSDAVVRGRGESA